MTLHRATMHTTATSSVRDDRLLQAAIGATALYLLGRVVLPLAGSQVVDAWRLSLGTALFGLAAALLVRQARARPELRCGWLLLAAGVAIYPVGTVLAATLGTAESAPPLAHAAWLTFYLFAYLALARLAHALVRPFPSAFLLDGVAVVLTIVATISFVAAAAGTPPYRLWEASLGVAYPSLDAVLLGYTLWIISVSPRPVARQWRRLVAAWALLLACDVIFVTLGALEDLSDVAVYTAGYPVVMVLLAWAATAPTPRAGPLTLDTRTAIAVPSVAMLLLLAVLVGVAIEPTGGPTVPFVVLALIALTARAVLIHRFAGRLALAQRFERSFDEAGVGMGICDVHGRWVRVNDALASLLGVDAEQVAGRDALAQIEGDRRSAARALRSALGGGPTAQPSVQLRVAVPGDTRDVLVTGDLVTGDVSRSVGEPQYFVQVRDVTAQERARRQADLVSALSRQALALEDLRELVGRMVPQLAEALEADLVAWIPIDDADELVTLPVPGALGPAVLDDLRAGGNILRSGDDEQAAVELTDPRALELGLPHLAGRGLRHVSFVAVQPRAAGRAALCVAHAVPPERIADERTCLDTVANVLATAADRAHDERASRHRALHDPLTGLANRALLSAHLAQAIAAARREDASIGVLLMDLDRFKVVNDTLGHEIGDALLRAVAARLEQHTREGDMLARLGGDEFVLVVSRVSDVEAVERAAARIVAALEAPIIIDDHELYAGVSTGLAIVPAVAATPEHLLREADRAMYRAKRAGGGRWARADGPPTPA